jgi:tRNA(fMet)-specific endonuclease VapC
LNSDVPALYLLDTNILSHLVRQPQGPVADHIADVGEANVLTSVIVACELRYGAAKRGSKKLTRQVEAVLSAMTIKPLASDVERVYASIRVALERKGHADWRARHADRRARASDRRGMRHGQCRRVQTRACSEG